MKTVQELILSRRGQFQGIAIACDGRTMSYAEFDELTDRVAAGLQREGIGPGSFVAIRMPRSERMVAAIFGVIKAGAAIVPISGDMPEERFRSISSACTLAAVIDEEKLAQLRQCEPAKLRLASETDPGMLLVTSGTTGRPKGVCQSQASVCRLYEEYPYQINVPGICPSEFSTIIGHLQQGFIVAYHYEYPVAMLNGKKLVLLTEEEQVSIPAFCRYLEENESCLLAIMPTQLAVFLDNERFCRATGHVSALQFFTEPVSDALREKIMRVFPAETSVISLYGQTETFGIGWRDERSTEPGMHPAAPVSLRLLDEDREAQAGETAEICIHSSTLFDRYYIEGPEGPDKAESARQFSKKNLMLDGERYVRTGDVGFLTDTGRIVLRGRNDRMVKLHGQRIELPEVERVILDYGSITRVGAVLGRTKTGTPVLAAFYTDDPSAPAEAAQLRDYLHTRLSPYMVPTVLVRLEQLPIGNNGKTDYRALEALVPDAAESDVRSATSDKPLSTLETLILQQAAQVLQTEMSALSADRSLVSQGMDSLAAILLISRLYDEGYVLSMPDFLKAESVHELAVRVQSDNLPEQPDTAPVAQNTENVQTATANEPAFRPEQDVRTSRVFPATDMQKTWIRRHFRVVKSYRIPFGIEEEVFRERAEQIVRNHPALRGVLFEDGDETFTKVLAQKEASWEYHDLRNLKPDRRQAAVGLYLTQLYGFPKPETLFCPIAFRTADDETAIIQICDHTAVDGLSEILLLENLLRESPEHQDAYISWLTYCHGAEQRKEAETFWHDYLQGAVPAIIPAPKDNGDYHAEENPWVTVNSLGLINPLDIAQSANRPGAYNIILSREETEALKQRCAALEVSLSSMVLFAYGSALLEVLGAESVFFECVISGRAMPVQGITETVGCLVNSVPVRITRGQSEKEFMNGCLMADRYGMLSMKEIMRAAFGTEMVPPVAGHINPLLFPEREGMRGVSPLYAFDYGVFPEGNFLWESADCLHLSLRYDPAQYDTGFTKKMVQRLEARLRKKA